MRLLSVQFDVTASLWILSPLPCGRYRCTAGRWSGPGVENWAPRGGQQINRNVPGQHWYHLTIPQTGAQEDSYFTLLLLWSARDECDTRRVILSISWQSCATVDSTPQPARRDSAGQEVPSQTAGSAGLQHKVCRELIEASH